MNKYNEKSDLSAFGALRSLPGSVEARIINETFLQTIKEGLKDIVVDSVEGLKKEFRKQFPKIEPDQPRKIDVESIQHFFERNKHKSLNQMPQIGAVVMKGQRLTKKDFKAVYFGEALKKNKMK